MIKAESIQASLSNGVVIHTIACEFPLTILNQLLTHRAFSRSSSSARAVPTETAIDQMLDDPYEPIFTKKGKGMSGDVVTDEGTLNALSIMHEMFMVTSAAAASAMDSMGVHKQNAGRYLTPYQNCRVLITATDWDNFDWLRNDKDAQPEIQELAKAIKAARDGADIMEINYKEYHVPFIKRHRAVNGELEYFAECDDGFTQVSTEEAINISMSSSAQTSYRKLDHTVEKAALIIPKLFGGKKVHASPSEHVATPMMPDMLKVIASGNSGITLAEALNMLQDGCTAINVDGTVSSGNFKGWVQQRQLIENHDGGTGEHTKSVDKGELPKEIEEIIAGLAKEFGSDVEITATEVKPGDLDKVLNKECPTPEEFAKLSNEDQAEAIKAITVDIISKLKK
jgi:hypothetical protein